MHKIQEVFINNADTHVCKGVHKVSKYKKISTVHFSHTKTQPFLSPYVSLQQT